jgi:hypothetical protein
MNQLLGITKDGAVNLIEPTTDGKWRTIPELTVCDAQLDTADMVWVSLKDAEAVSALLLRREWKPCYSLAMDNWSLLEEPAHLLCRVAAMALGMYLT